MKIIIIAMSCIMFFGCASPRIIETTLRGKTYYAETRDREFPIIINQEKLFFTVNEMGRDRIIPVSRPEFDMYDSGERIMYLNLWGYRAVINNIERYYEVENVDAH